MWLMVGYVIHERTHSERRQRTRILAVSTQSFGSPRSRRRRRCCRRHRGRRRRRRLPPMSVRFHDTGGWVLLTSRVRNSIFI